MSNVKDIVMILEVVDQNELISIHFVNVVAHVGLDLAGKLLKFL